MVIAVTILIVDDEEAIRRMVSTQFKMAGYDVKAASSTHEARCILRVSPVDVVLSDECLPGGTGTDLILWVHEHFPQTLTVMMTGLHVDYMPLGVRILSKPKEIFGCVAVIAELFKKKREEPIDLTFHREDLRP